PVSASAISSTVTRKRTWRTMPRVAGLSVMMLVLPIPCRPSARMVARLRAMWLMVLLVWVTFSLAATGDLPRHGHRRRLPGDAADQLDAAAGAELLRWVQGGQGPDRRHGHRQR